MGCASTGLGVGEVSSAAGATGAAAAGVNARGAGVAILSDQYKAPQLSATLISAVNVICRF
jgi:hypothetical protein